MVAIDGGTAGAAEVLAAALQDQRRAALFGSTSRGAAASIATLELRSPKGTIEGAVRLRERIFSRADRTPIEGRGVIPDRAAAGDAAVEAALDWLAAAAAR